VALTSSGDAESNKAAKIVGLNMITRRLVLLALASCQIILLLNNAKGQSGSQTVVADQIRCSITAEDGHWSNDKPALVTIRLENLAEKDISLWSAYTFYLTKMTRNATSRIGLGDSYYSSAGMIKKHGRVELVPNDPKHTIVIKRTRSRIVSRFANEEIHLRKGEVKLIKIDLRPFLWADSMHSGSPTSHLFDVIPSGKYYLQFEIRPDKKVKLTSNQIEVQVV